MAHSKTGLIELKSPGWVIGLAAGLAVAIGGAIKDAPYEGFSFITFVRSPVIGTLAGWTIEKQLKVTNPATLFLATIGAERIVVEGYKLVRAKKPGKFVFGEWGVPKTLKQQSNGVQQSTTN